MPNHPVFRYGEDHLTSGIALSIARGSLKGIFSANTREKVTKSSQIVADIAMGEESVYGINTGFGPLCTTKIESDATLALQRNILMSHAVGVGESIDALAAKLMLVLKVHALSQGFSGVKMETLERIIWHIDQNIIPVVPAQGSVGASGDLAPLSHLFLPLIGLGKVFYKGEKTLTQDLFAKEGIRPIQLGAKEGLGLINGTQFIAAHAILVVEYFHNALSHADLVAAMTVEGMLGSIKPFASELHKLRPYKGSQHVAEKISVLLGDSEIMASHANCTRVQDPYSLRCVPQVHGASWNAWLHLKEMVEVEINSVTDNPVVFDRDHTISGGNFHGQPLAIPLDYACVAASEIGNISDRRIYLSLEGHTPGVPKLLLKETGTNSGFMIPQYTTAALVSENKGLCFPSSADSIPTSLGQEDHVSMGSIGSRKALRVISNVQRILGIEVFCSSQALDFHRPLKSNPIIAKVHAYVRQSIEHIERDQLMIEQIEAATRMVTSGSLLEVANSVAAETGRTLSTEHSQHFDNY